MLIDVSDSGDGIVFEHGGQNRVRAVVMRYGQRICSDYRKTKSAALRNLVVIMAHRLSQQQRVEFCYHDKPDDLRLIIADGLEGLAQAKFTNDEHRVELFVLNGKETIVMDIDRLYRGAWILRWVQKRENAQ